MKKLPDKGADFLLVVINSLTQLLIIKGPQTVGYIINDGCREYSVLFKHAPFFNKAVS